MWRGKASWTMALILGVRNGEEGNERFFLSPGVTGPGHFNRLNLAANWVRSSGRRLARQKKDFLMIRTGQPFSGCLETEPPELLVITGGKKGFLLHGAGRGPQCWVQTP